MANGSGHHQPMLETPLPVPEAEAEALVSKVDQMIEQLDLVITDRASARSDRLASWDAPNRALWEEDFHYSQTDLAAAIDSLQWFKNRIDSVLEAVRERNASIAASPTMGPGGGGGTW
jgi:hypothetical protein